MLAHAPGSGRRLVTVLPAAVLMAAALPYLSACTSPGDADADDSSAVEATPTDPASFESCDGRDNDGDGLVDADDPDLEGGYVVYRDQDTDGSGAGDPMRICDIPGEGYASRGGDCDDLDPSVYPDAPESCNDGVDQDCDRAWGCLNGVVRLDRVYAWLEEQEPGSATGAAVLLVDLNGDPYGDLVVSSPWWRWETGGGRVSIFFGPLEGELRLEDADATLISTQPEDTLGVSLAAGDLSGDGIPDLALGAIGRCYYGLDEAPALTGRVYVVYGPFTGTIDVDAAQAILEGEPVDGCAGSALSASGDLNRDGQADLVVGAMWDETEARLAGAVYAIFGPIEGERSLTTADVIIRGDEYGWTGATLSQGDVNGDGDTDLLIGNAGGGTESKPRWASLFYGPFAGHYQIGDADAVIVGEPLVFGGAVAIDGDIDGDGNPDIAVGEADCPGAVYIFGGPLYGEASVSDADVVLIEEDEDDLCIGFPLSLGNDLNADGRADLVTGALGANPAPTSEGALYIFYGPLEGAYPAAAPHAQVIGRSGDVYLGGTVSVGGDADGDGRHDLVTSAPGTDYVKGRVYVLLAGRD